MPEAQEQFQTGVAKVLEAVMFENWLRFYFISEKPDAPTGRDGQPALFVAVPTKAMERISEMFPRLLPMAEELNGQEVSFESSRRAVCNFVLAHVDGQVIVRDSAAMIFESATFQVQMQLFNTWVQMHEEQLDRSFVDFGGWQRLFDEWRTTPAARELAEKLSISVQGAVAAPEEGSVQ